MPSSHDPRPHARSRAARAVRVPVLALALCAAGAFAAPAGAQALAPRDAGWHDASPHRVFRVNTGRDVDVEVLDWGGHGPPLIFLAGFGNSAHVWDDFAPRFVPGYHVIAITRRGFGASSKPAEGYDSGTLANDILAVMDQMRWERALFVAHSFGGSELNWLATHMPRRVIRMVYLDAAFDFAELYADPPSGPSPRPSFPEDDPRTPASVAAWMSVFAGPGYPESEVRAMYEVDASGHVGQQRMVSGAEQKLRAGVEPVMLTRFFTAALALYAAPRNAREKYPWYNQMSPAEQTAAQARFESERRMVERQQSRFRVARASGIVEVQGGRHYLFLTNPDYVEARIRRYFNQPIRGKNSLSRRGSYTYQTIFGPRWQ